MISVAKFRRAAVLVVLVVLPTSAVAEPPADHTLSPYFVLQNADPTLDQLPLKETAVHATVTGVIAAVTIRQSYTNEGTRPIHARYVFPASTRAAVHGMRMTVGNRVVTAQLKEREEARRTFEKAKRAGKSASLLEQQRPNVFTMELSNVMPGDRIEVELDYSELLVPEAGVYEFVYPTVVGPRYSSASAARAPERDRFVASPYTRARVPPVSELHFTGSLTAGVPLADVQSPSHRFLTHWEGNERVEFELDPSERHGGDRDVILRYRLTGEAIESGLLLYPGEGDDDGFFLLMVQPPRRPALEEIPPREYVFIVDVSGSMRGFPLRTTKALLRALTAELRPEDRFNVVLFSGGARTMSPESLPATPLHLQAAFDVIDGERGGGGTELKRALDTAMALPTPPGMSRSFVVITDGYISAEESVFRAVRAGLGEANVFSFGVGGSVNRYLLDGLARAGMGRPFTVTAANEIAEVTERFREYVARPVLTDVEIDYRGFDVADVEPAALPDVLADRPIVVRGRWRGTPTGSISVSGMTGRGFWTHELDVAGVPSRAEHRPLRTLWARERLASLSDFNFGRPHTKDERAEIVELGLEYGLLTRYTSFVAVHDVVRNADGDAEPVDQPLPLPRGVAETAIGRGPEPPLTLLLIVGGLAMLLAGRLRGVLS